MVTETREPISKRIMRNTAFNAVGRAWMIGTNLLLTPLFLSYRGQDRFAIWVIFWSLTQYFLLLDLGVGTALVKYFSEYEAKGDAESINQVVTSVLLFYLVLGGLLLVVLWPVMAQIASLLAIPRDLLPEAIRAFHMGLVVLFLMNLVALFDGMLKGFQRMDITNATMMGVSIPNFLGSYLVLYLGWGLLGLALTVVGVYLLQLFLLIVLAKKVFPALCLRMRHLRVETIRLLFGYGLRLQIFRVTELVSYQIDKILLGLFVPIRYVTFYDLGSKVSSLLRDFPYVMVTPIFPAASELASLGDRDRLWLMYERGTKYLLLLTVPMLAGIAHCPFDPAGLARPRFVRGPSGCSFACSGLLGCYQRRSHL